MTKCNKTNGSLINLKFISITIFLVFTFFGTNLWAQKPLEGKILMAVFAHPDDERRISPIMAKFVREGAKVHLVIATDGRYGTNDFTDHESGEELVVIRKEEMKCAASKLGVNLIHLNYHDQLRSGEGYDGHIPHARSLIKELYHLIEQLKPDAIITWGPDGETNHIDHRLVGASVTQAFISRKWEKPSTLYYYGIPSEQLPDAEQKSLIGLDKKFLKAKIAYKDEDFKKAEASLACHISQINEEGMKKFRKNITDNGNYVYLRKFLSSKDISDTVFE
jgi:LmbE family N-acetylglucosaminyl deacetylase